MKSTVQRQYCLSLFATMLLMVMFTGVLEVSAQDQEINSTQVCRRPAWLNSIKDVLSFVQRFQFEKMEIYIEVGLGSNQVQKMKVTWDIQDKKICILPDSIRMISRIGVLGDCSFTYQKGKMKIDKVFFNSLYRYGPMEIAIENAVSIDLSTFEISNGQKMVKSFSTKTNKFIMKTDLSGNNLVCTYAKCFQQGAMPIWVGVNFKLKNRYIR